MTKSKAGDIPYKEMIKAERGATTQPALEVLRDEAGFQTPGDQEMIDAQELIAQVAVIVVAFDVGQDLRQGQFKRATFNGQKGNSYGFYSMAHDGAGNVEVRHLAAEATTAIQAGIISSPPSIAIALTDHQVVLSWPTNAGDYVLQTTTNLLRAN